ncbi:LacI family DNA-binding transcriptional regulator [Pseudahrensia aquimaris]|uniref:LacI family DNA-binding transcriptional regulator n=1 Tax=Pseudahrensia aquimaris TaxID=744461 RepID=A0ABW3FCB9_9HYPH
MERAKIEDVAEAAGVSIMSVSRAMRGVEGLSPKTRAKILKIAKRMNYQPSSVAGALAAANSTLIGVSVPTLDDAVFGEIFEGMRPVFNRLGFQTVFDTTEYRPEREEAWIERMIAWRPAGIVLSGITHSRTSRRKLSESGIPTLEIWDYSADPIDICIGIDHREAGRQAARYLLSLGYHRPAYVGVEQGRDVRADKRVQGFREVFDAAGCALIADVRLSDAVSFEAGQKGVSELLARAAQPDVVHFLNDHMAFGGKLEFERCGVPVPQGVGIVGFNGLNINGVLDQPITTIKTPRAQMGKAGATMLVARIANAITQRAVLMQPELIEGGTTRAAHQI